MNNEKGSNEILVAMKKILDFSCYVKLERNGLEFKIKSQGNTVSKVLVQENWYKQKEITDQKRMVNKVIFKSPGDQEYFSFEVNCIERIVDKMIGEGKLTLIISKSVSEKYNVFFSKTTREVLDNFVNLIGKLKSNINSVNSHNSNNNSNKSNNLNNQISKSNQNNLSSNSKHQNKNQKDINLNFKSTEEDILKNKKRKLQDLYAMANNQSIPSHNLQFKKFKKNPENTKQFEIKKRIHLLELPDDILSGIFEYVDSGNIIKVSLLNKECKKTYDKGLLSLKLRDETPTHMYNTLLKRFYNIQHLKLGKSKYLKNENFKYFDVDLKNLTSLDISEVTNLNDASIRKFLSKTKSKKITSLKLNFYSDCLTSALVYVEEFFSNIRDLEIYYSYQKHKFNLAFLKELENSPRYYHPSLYTRISQLVLSKPHIKNLSTFIFNSSKIIENLNNNLKQSHLFINLHTLSISILIIEKIKDLRLFSSAVNLINFNINEIVKVNTTDRSLKRCNFEEMNIISGEFNPEEQLNNLSLDFDNDYIEIFISSFSKMKSLQSLSLGEFVNGEILKIIALFCKKITSLTLNSNKITDDQLKEILLNCAFIEKLDLRGSSYIQGNCFIEVLDNLSSNLKNIKFSLTNFNFYNLFAILKNKGITSENFIYKQ